MAQRDPRIDAYIARQAAFAQPILSHLRALVHEACPEVEETIKWGAPSFQHGGGILCGMAAFKQHASFGYWRHAELFDDAQREGMGSYGRLTSLADLPPRDTLLAHLRKAAALNAAGSKPARKRSAAAAPAPVEPPPEFAAALRAHPAARATFEGFPPGQQREYVAWINDAKREQTRASRVAQAVAWLAEGKRRNWKYERC